MRRWAGLLLVLMVVTSLFGQEPDKEELTRRLEAAKADFAAATEAAGIRYKEIEADFDLVRSEVWATVSAPYVKAVAGATPGGGPTLEAEFIHAAFLSETTCRRLAAEVLKLLAAGPGDPAEVFAKALSAVFPKPSFPECWEAVFLDLPEVSGIARAAEAVKSAEAALAAGSPPVPPEPPVAPPEEAAADRPPGMVLVPKGAFVFGPWTGWVSDLKSNKEDKERVEAFYIDVHEVTNAQYRNFLSKVAKGQPLYTELPEGFVRAADGSLTLPEGAEDLPVRGVSLDMASAYAESVGKRLPTEEEWEKAARGEDGRLYPWGAEWKEGVANLKDGGIGAPAPVGAFGDDRSPYGVLDMAGNVAEITATLDGRRPVGRKVKPTDSIILRGGSINDGKDAATTTYRWILPAISKGEWVGFRCAMPEKAFKRPTK